MNIYSRINGAGNFVFLDTVPSSSWDDMRRPATPGVSELREFYGMPVAANKEVGQPSTIVSVNFKG